jgi:hypothetical protein
MAPYPRHPPWKAGKYVFVFLYLSVILLLAGLVQLLWNALLPGITGARTVNYWQALGLLVLCRILFGSFRFYPGRGRPLAGRPRLLKERWMQMNEAERAAFKAEWKRRCAQRRT